MLFVSFPLNIWGQNYHKDVQFGLECLHKGELTQAYCSFEKAAKFGDLLGQYYWAKCLSNGYGIEQDEKRAFSVLRRVAERGLPVAQAELGYVLLSGKGVEKNLSKGLYWIDKVEDSSSIDAYSSYVIGLCYEYGHGRVKNIQKALEYFQYSMSKNVDDAYIHVAQLYVEGLTVAKDYSKAMQIIDEALERIGSAFDWAYKGRLLLLSGDTQRANEMWQGLLSKYPFYAMEGKDEFCGYMRQINPISPSLIQDIYAQNNNINENEIKVLGDDNKKNELKSTIINITYATPQPVYIPKVEPIATPMVAVSKSEVDINIPQGQGDNERTFVVIVANENYRREELVPYANNDGEIFKEYCIKALSIPEKNIKYVADASLNDLKYNLNWLKQVMDVYQGKAKVMFYYAGHGIPDEANKTAYLLPVDGYASDIATGYSLKTLYGELGQMPAKSVLVLLDACFSGSKREGDMLASARGVAIKVKGTVPKGNMVVFSAAQGDETAYPYKEQRHGMFTYYLLKKLQETKGEATLGEISDYVTSEVRKQSIVINGKMQTPTLTSSSAIGDSWRNWKLK